MAKLVLALVLAAAGCQATPEPVPASPSDTATPEPTLAPLVVASTAPPQPTPPAGPPSAGLGPSPAVLQRPKPTPTPSRRPAQARALSGLATYWQASGAAAGPLLRRLLGPHYLGKRIRVWVDGRGPVILRVITSCACGDRHGQHTIVDLPTSTILALGLGTGQGVYDVRVEEIA